MKKLLAIIVTVILCVTAAACAEIGAAPIASFEDVEWVDGTNLLVKRGQTGYGLVGIDGAAVTEEVYYDAFDYEHGVITTAKVSEDPEENNIYGAIGMDGKEIIPFQYGHIDVDNSTWAICYKLVLSDMNNYDFETFIGNNYYLVETVDIYNLKSAACVASLTREQFGDFYALPRGIVIQDRSGKINAYDAQFNLVAENMDSLYSSQGIEGLEISDDVPSVYYEDYGTFGLKDPQGNVILEPTFDRIADFKEGYATIEENGKTGLIDMQGNVVVQPLYDEIVATSFARAEYGYDSKGYFAVVQDGKLGYVDANGNVTVEPKYSEEALEYRGLTCNYMDMMGNFCLLAADGTETAVELLEDVSDGALDYSYGMYYKVYDADYNYGLIDWHGELVFPYEYDDFSLSGDGAYMMVEKDYVCDIYEVK